MGEIFPYPSGIRRGERPVFHQSRPIIEEEINHLFSAEFVRVVLLGRLPLNVSFQIREEPVELLPVNWSLGIVWG
jgi:hypothetical protein